MVSPRYLCAAVLLHALFLPVMASPVSITNANMEAAPTARTDGLLNSVIATGWTGSGVATSFFTFNPGAAIRYYNAPEFVDTGATGGASGTMAGPNFTGVFSASTSRTIEQTLTATLAANTTYTLKAALGHRTIDSGAAATASVVTVELLAGGVVIASATADPSTGIWNGTDVWADATAAGATGPAPAQLGQPLVIRFTKAAAGDYMDIDNVRLDATPVVIPTVVDLANGMIGYFPFSADFSNRCGLVDGLAFNGALAGQAGGIAGNAMTLRSTGGTANERMNLGIGYGATSGSATNLGRNFTLGAWYKLDQPPAGSASGRYFVYEGDGSTGDGFEVSYGLRDLALGTAGLNDGQIFTDGGSTNVADAGTAGWHHILQTYASNGTTTTITTFIDGVNVGTLSSPTAGLVDGGLNFGSARTAVTDRGFDGMIDEVALWNRVLNAEEIQTVRTLGLSGQALVQPPVIASFTSSSSLAPVGGQATLSWNVTGAAQVSISPDIGTVSSSGSATVTINSATTYILTATAEGGLTEQSRVSIGLDRGLIHVFLLGGQSNMQGVGQKSKLTALGLESIPEVLLYHSTSVVSSGGANRLIPVQAAGSDATGFGPEIGFADVMRDLCRGDAICLIKHAVGGTSLQMKWKPGANNADTANFGVEYQNFITTVNAGMAALRAQGYRPVIDGMLWQQGEQDSKGGVNTAGDGNSTSAIDYGANLKQFVTRVRQQFAADISPDGMRFVLGQVAPYAPVVSVYPQRDIVRQAELDADENSGAPLSIPNTAAIPTDDVNYPVHAQELDGYADTDQAHFNWSARLLLGRNMAYRMLRLTPKTYAEWVTARGVTGGPTDDDDHDGVPNRIEFAFGSDPKSPASAAHPVATPRLIGGVPYLTLTHTRDLNALGATFAAEASSDLGTWQSTAVFIDSVRQPDGTAVVRYRLPWPINDPQKRQGFLRIRVP